MPPGSARRGLAPSRWGCVCVFAGGGGVVKSVCVSGAKSRYVRVSGLMCPSGCPGACLQLLVCVYVIVYREGGGGSV